jgi:hypothetical protein
VVLQLLRFSVLASLVGLPLMLGARTVEERPKVLVSVFNKAGVDDATVLLAEKMVSQIYEEAGLSIIWKNCLAQPELERERYIETVDNRHFVLSIEHQARTLETDIYGVAFLGEDGSGSYCNVFYDRIAELNHRGRASEATILESVDRIIYSILQRFNLEWKIRTLNLFTQAAKRHPWVGWHLSIKGLRCTFPACPINADTRRSVSECWRGLWLA